MKKIILSLIILIIALTSYSQPCPTSNIRLSSQAHVDSFPILYPGCNVLEFDIIIGSESENIDSDITNLLGLVSIEQIKAQLIIENTDNLQSLEGLENLKRIYSNFQLKNNAHLSDVSSLQSIDSLNAINLETNPLLTEYGIFQQLSYGRSLYISNDKSLKELSDFPIISGLSHIELNNCDSLKTLSGLVMYSNLDSLSIIENKNLISLGQLIVDSLQLLNIKSNEKITNLDGLESLKYAEYITIEGNLNLQTLEGLNNLSNIPIHWLYYSTNILIKDNPNLLSLSGLESVYKLHSISLINNDKLKNLTGLESLRAVEYTFNISDNDSLLTFEGLNMTYDTTEHYFFCGNHDYEYGLIIRNNSSLENLSGLSHLDRIFGNLIIEDNSKLKDLSGLNNIKRVEGSLVLIKNNTSLENVLALNKFERVGYSNRGYLEISHNPLITNLNGLNSLNLESELSIDINSNEGLTSLSGLTNPIELKNLSIRSNPKLSNISNISDLEKISSLRFINNDLIENLNAFSKINSSVHLIDISRNDKLKNISGIRGIQEITTKNCMGQTYNGCITISDNPMLKECAIIPICNALISSNVNKNIVNNGLGCNSPEEINCGEISISGFVFYDQNQNGIFDGGENGIPNIRINFNPPDQNILTKLGGKYSQFCEEGTEYQITFPDFENFTLTTSTNKYTITFESGNAINYDNNFGVYAINEIQDVVSNISSNPTRCNRQVPFYLSIENLGIYEENGFLRLDFDSLCNYSWSNPIADSINLESNFLLWDIENFKPFDFEQIDVLFDMPDETYTGTLLNFTSSVTLDSAGTDIMVSEYTYSPTVLCSYDPNDKIAMPAGVYAENYTLKDEKMTYTVRFQNTGNAPAIDVTIVDTLSDFLDIETFRVVNSSFTPQTIINGREVTFLFSNINLVDSISDERNSHGFVTFEINPISDIDDFSEIENTAHIIFDSNSAIITNTVKNTMVTTIPTNAIDNQLLVSYSVFPNPINPDQRIFIDYKLDDQDMDIRISLYNNLGQEVLSQRGKNGLNEISIAGTLPGIYFIGLKNGKRLIKASKVIVQN